MTREQIEKAAMLSCASKDEVLTDFGCNCFVEGAQWRINSVWHDGNVSCEPRRTAVVLFKNGNANIYKDLRDLSYEGLWGEVDKFAYLGDLIPERKEAGEQILEEVEK